MTDREKQQRNEKLNKVGKGIGKSMTVIKTLFVIIGLIIGGLFVFGCVSAVKAITTLL